MGQTTFLLQISLYLSDEILFESENGYVVSAGIIVKHI